MAYITQDKEIKKWISKQTFVFSFIAWLSYAVMEIIVHFMGGQNTQDYVIKSIILIIIIIIFNTSYNFYIARSSNRHISDMSYAIRRIAQGDFDFQIDTKYSKAMHEVYDNVNLLAQELKKNQLFRDDFINNYSHEFKTPIGSINGFAELLLKSDMPEEEKRTYLQLIYDESARLADLTDSALLLSNIDNRNIINNKENYSLDEQVRQCAISFTDKLKKKEIRFSNNMEHIIYKGDQVLMRHLWTNLLSNAIKFTPPKGEISISMFKSNDHVVFNITDNGIGMNRDQIQQIFNKYYKSDQNSGNTGLGLGLNIVKRIVELCNGRIEVKSQVDKGSTFTVFLPLQSNI